MVNECNPGPFQGTIADIRDGNPPLYNLRHLAEANGVYAEFMQFNSSRDKDDPCNGVYFCVMPSEDYYRAYLLHESQLSDLLQQNREKSDHMVNCYYNFVYIPELSRTNIFEVHNEMCKAIRDTAIVKNLFFKYGYHIPNEIHKQTIWNLYHFYNRSMNTDFPQDLRANYEKSLHKIVSEAYQRYTKYENMPDAHVSPRIQDHEVPEDYFIKSSIPATYDNVSGEFFEWIKEHIGEYPGFIFYKEDKPYLTLKDLSQNKELKNHPSFNFWKNMKGDKLYNIGFPTCQEKMFFAMGMRYNTRSYDGQTPYNDFIKNYPGKEIYKSVRMDDMWNIDSLCKANHVPYCIDANVYDSGLQSIKDTERVILLIRASDEENYGHITSRLAEETRGDYPVYRPLQIEARKNQPDYYNPYVIDSGYTEMANKQIERERNEKQNEVNR